MPRCPECRAADFRAQNGCDEDAKTWVWRATCPDCGGGDDACARCEGSGTAGFYRCPASMVDADTRALMDSYAAYDRHGVLPAPGGWNDQARGWVKAVRVIEAERAVIEAAREARRRAAAKAKGGG